MKKTLIIVIALILSLATFTACAKTTQLSAPTELSLDGNTLFWSKVDNADGYEVNVNGDILTVPYNWCEVPSQKGKSLSIKVKALGSGKYSDSPYSEEFVRNATSETQLTKLVSPEIKEINGKGVMRWSVVSNADGYKIFKNNVLYDTVVGANVSTYTLDITEPGTYSIQVQAYGRSGIYTDSNKSNVYVLVIDGSGNPRLPTISTPIISYDADSEKIVWNKITNAVKYSVFLNGVIVAETEELNYKFDPKLTENSYTVVANGDGESYGNSKDSNAIVFPLSPDSPPLNIRIESVDGVSAVVWDSVKYSRGYRVEVDGLATTSLNPYFKFAGYADGEYEIRVRSLGDNTFYSSSLYSESLAVKVKDGGVVKKTLSTPDLHYYVSSTRTLVWGEVAHALKYKLTVETPYDDKLTTYDFYTEETSYVLDEVFEDVDLVFYLTAIAEAGYGDSLRSSGLSYSYTRSYDYIDENMSRVHVEADEYSFLTAPSDISYDNGKFTWYSHEDAQRFLLRVNEQTFAVEGTSYSYKMQETSVVTVVALSDDEFVYDSPKSEEKLFEYPVRLSTPKIQLNGKQLIIVPIEGADHYEVHYNDEYFESTLTTIDLEKNIVIDGVYTLYVQAIGGEGRSSSMKSVELSFTVDYGEYGTKEKPFPIESVEDLILLNENPLAYFVFTVDTLDFEGKEISPLFADEIFAGHIDGDGCVIKNATLKAVKGYNSFFGRVSNGEIKNLTFENILVKDGDYCGIVATYFNGSMENVKTLNCKFNVDAITLGGLIAEGDGEMKKCVSDNVVIVDKKSRASIGGLAGRFEGDILDCSVSGRIEGESSTVGGAVANHKGKMRVTVSMDITVGGASKTGLAVGSADGEYYVALSGSITTGGGYVGAFGQINGKVSGSAEGDITASGEFATVGGVAGIASIDDLSGLFALNIDVEAAEAIVGGVAGVSQKAFDYDENLELSLKVKADTAYVGVVGKGSINYGGTPTGEIKVDQKTTFVIVRCGVVGETDDLFFGLPITLKGDIIEYNDKPLSGEGSESSPYIIATINDFIKISKEPSAYYSIVEDIYLSTPALIADDFRGTLSGGGHVLRGIAISGEKGALFGSLTSATIKDLYIESSSFHGSLGAAAIAFEATDSTFENVCVNANLSAESGTVGGLVAKATDCRFERCGFNGRIDALSSIAGGLVAQASGSISDSFVIGKINCLSGGGFAYSSTADIEGCYASVFDGAEENFAGFVYDNGGSVKNCYSSSELKEASLSFAAGSGSVTNCYVTSSTLRSFESDPLYMSLTMAFEKVFDGWDNSQGYSRIPDLPYQTTENTCENVRIDLVGVLSFPVSNLDLTSYEYFGVAKITLPLGVSIVDKDVVLSGYGDYEITFNFVDKTVTAYVHAEEIVNEDFEGKGTETEPYLVANEEQFAKMDGYETDVWFKLTSDLTAPYVSSFSSKLDGNGKTLTLSDKAFGAVENATIKNLKIKYVSNNSVGVIIEADESVFESIQVEVTAQFNATEAGALVRVARNCSFKDVSVTGVLRGSGVNVGGLTGTNKGENAKFENVVLSLEITVVAENVGGLAGETSSVIKNVEGSVRINSTANRIGGLAGEAIGKAEGVDLTVDLNSSSSYLGGLFGYADVESADINVDITVDSTVSDYFGGVAAVAETLEDVTVLADVTLTVTENAVIGGVAGECVSADGGFNGTLTVTATKSIVMGGAVGNGAFNGSFEGSASLVSSSADANVYLGGVAGKGSVDESTFSGTLSFSGENEKGRFVVGGLIGDGTVDSSAFDGDISIDFENTEIVCGGIAGESTLIKDSAASGSLTMSETGSEFTYGGSVIGVLSGEESEVIQNVTSSVTVTCDVTAGIAGDVTEKE